MPVGCGAGENIGSRAAVRPIVVVGSPRSGTTLLGNYLGSSADVCNLGEYGGFHFVLRTAEDEFRRLPTSFKGRYLSELRQHAIEFPIRMAGAHGCRYYCDATPSNILVLRELVPLLPSALFVLTIRHFAGVIQSLRRSYGYGYLGAGTDVETSASLWASCYQVVPVLPSDRTVVVGYDQLCRTPRVVLDRLHSQLARHGLDSNLDRAVLAESHATPETERRPTLAVIDESGAVVLKGCTSVDTGEWTPELQVRVAPIVAETHAMLQLQYPTIYEDPLSLRSSPSTERPA
jgi:hypothetical protein